MKAKPTKSAAKPKLYRSISEVSAALDVKAHVLRYWEEQFPMLRPKKNRAGNRMYRPEDLELLKRIKELVHTRRFTIEGARQRLTEDRKAGAGAGKRAATGTGAAAARTSAAPKAAAAPVPAPPDGEAEALRAALTAASARAEARAAVVAEVRDELLDLARHLRERAAAPAPPAETTVV